MISVVIITKNEEKNIENCIKSLSWADDIHIIDSGSTDNTLQIAKDVGVSVHIREFVSYSEQHNWAHKYAGLKYNWVLHMDADERSTSEFKEAILNAVFGASSNTLGYYCCWKLMMGPCWVKRSDCYPRWQLRLVRKEIEPYIEFGHAQKEKKFPDGTLKYIQEPYLHYPWSKGWEHWFSKHNTYSTKEAKQALSSTFLWKDLFSKHPSKRVFTLKLAFRKIGIAGPFFRFFYCYIFRLGFLDGYPGFLYALAMAIYEFLIYVKCKTLKQSL